jgi:polysaccharide chain length determinant protein (PEP-CTERM system associated)
MLPGKRYTPEAILRILWRRKWVLVVPLVIIATVTAVIARRLPNRYRSETLVLIVPQQIPESYVQPTVSARLEDRLASLNQQILNRTRLEQIIREFDLYAEERRTAIMEDVVDRMRSRDIGVQTTGAVGRDRAAPTFRISFSAPDPRTAMRVTERLASLFIEESLRDRATLAEGTNQFLDTQLLDARNRLVEQEKRLEAYRQKHAGELPSQLSSNLQAMQNIQQQLQRMSQSIAQDRDRQLMLDRLISEAEALAEIPVATTTGGRVDESGLSAAQLLELRRAELRDFELRMRPGHPDLERAKRVVAELEQKVDQEALQQPLSPGGDRSRAGVPLNRADAQRQARMREMEAERDALPRRIAQKEKELARMQDVLGSYQARVAAVPSRETELVELTRDYETIRNAYTSLLAKSENARMSASLERRQIGEQFRVLEPARMPERPISPNRVQINTMGALGGLALGLGLVLLLEYRDRTMRTENDVRSALGLPVLAVIRTLGIPDERRRPMMMRLVPSRWR